MLLCLAKNRETAVVKLATPFIKTCM